MFTDDVRAFTSYSFKPNFKTLKTKYGKYLGKIKPMLESLDGNATMDELNAKSQITLDIDGESIVLLTDDLLIETAQIEGYVSGQEGEITVALDTNLTPELLEEGFVRELISKVQTMRKEAGFEVMDRIVVYAKDNEKISALLKSHGEELKAEVLADDIVLDRTEGYTKEWNINGETVTLGVEKQ